MGLYMTQNLWYIGCVIQQLPKLNDIATFANSKIKPFITLRVNLKRGIMLSPERGTIPMVVTTSFDFLAIYSRKKISEVNSFCFFYCHTFYLC